jgi:hypothetical protein
MPELSKNDAKKKRHIEYGRHLANLDNLKVKKI